MVAQTKCYLCGSRRLTHIADIRSRPDGETDFGFLNYQRSIYRCQNCDVYCNIHDHIGEGFYKRKYDEDTYGSRFHARYQMIRALPKEESDSKQRVERVASVLDRLGLPREQVRVLDVGSGLGVFPAEVKDMGFRCYCIDPDASAIRHIVQNVKVDGAHIGTLDDFKPEHKFDLISFNNVLEHIREPVQCLARAKDFLANNGIVYVELPDGSSALRQGNATERQEFYIEHFTIFNKTALVFLAQVAGFDCLEVGEIREPSGKFTVYGFLRR